MTRQDVQVSFTKIGVVLGALGAFWLLVVALRDVQDARYITRVEMARRDSSQALKNYRDSLFQQKVGRWVDYQNCKEQYGVRQCLRPDRP